MAETLGEQYDPALPSPLRQSSARKPLPTSLPRETRVIRPEEECCPACGGELSLGCDVSEQLELISSAFKVIIRLKLACCRCDQSCRESSTFKTHCTQLCRSGASGPCCHREICRPSAVIPPVRNIPSSRSGAEPCHTGALDRCRC